MSCAAAQSLPFGPDGADEPAATDRDVQEIVAEQAALRRAATSSPAGVPTEELFAVVSQELAAARRSGRGSPAAGSAARPDHHAARRAVSRSRRAGSRGRAGAGDRGAARAARHRPPRPVGPADVPLTGPFITEIRRLGIRAAVAVPIHRRRPRMGGQRGRLAEPGAVPRGHRNPDGRVRRARGDGDQQHGKPRRAGGLPRACHRRRRREPPLDPA